MCRTRKCEPYVRMVSWREFDIVYQFFDKVLGYCNWRSDDNERIYSTISWFLRVDELLIF